MDALGRRRILPYESGIPSRSAMKGALVGQMGGCRFVAWNIGCWQRILSMPLVYPSCADAIVQCCYCGTRPSELLIKVIGRGSVRTPPFISAASVRTPDSSTRPSLSNTSQHSKSVSVGMSEARPLFCVAESSLKLRPMSPHVRHEREMAEVRHCKILAACLTLEDSPGLFWARLGGHNNTMNEGTQQRDEL
jgi:hypothetical protein